MRKGSWKKYGALMALFAVWSLCAAVNTGGAWWGDPGTSENSVVTWVYLLVVTALTLLCWRIPLWAKTMWRFSWLSLVCCLMCAFCAAGDHAWGLIFAPLAAVPFYGLYGQLPSWTATYLGGAAVSLFWILLSWRGVRKAEGKDAGWRATLTFLTKLAGAVLLGVALFFVNAFAGNPVSALLARHAAREYIAAEYSHLDLTIEKVGYDLKGSNYYAKVQSCTSVDTHFSVYISMLGQVERDTYDRVESRYTTFERLNREYYDLIKAVKEEESFPYTVRALSGTLRGSNHGFLDYGLPQEGLVLDGEYDVRELGTLYGGLHISVFDEEISIPRGCEILKDVTARLEEKGIAFRAIDLNLSRPDRKETGLILLDFPVEYLEDEDLEERVRENYERTMDYYGEEAVLK